MRVHADLLPARRRRQIDLVLVEEPDVVQRLRGRELPAGEDVAKLTEVLGATLAHPGHAGRRPYPGRV